MTTTKDDEKMSAKIAEVMDHLSKVVADGADGEQARAALQEWVKNQGVITREPEVPAVVVDALTLGEKKIARPNGDFYWIRKFGAHDDVSALRKAREEGLPILAYGPPGTGKTALIEAAYAVDGKTVYTVQGTGDTDTADFIGSFTQLPGGKFEWNDGPLLKAMVEGAVLYIDEIALIDPKVMAVVYSVMDGRGEYNVTQNPERGIVHAEEGFYIASACNPNAPGAKLSEAILSRFVLQFEVLTDYSLAKKLGVAPKMVTVSQNLQRKVESNEIGWAPQLRECLAFRDISKALGEDIALRNVIASAPDIDREQVKDALERGFGREIAALSIS